jgi:acyl carrier protein
MTGNRTSNLTVMNTLKAILVGLGIPEDTIGEDTLIHAHLGLDSVETVKLSLELKRELDLDLKLGTRQDLTLAEICQMVATTVPTRSA